MVEQESIRRETQDCLLSFSKCTHGNLPFGHTKGNFTTSLHTYTHNFQTNNNHIMGSSIKLMSDKTKTKQAFDAHSCYHAS